MKKIPTIFERDWDGDRSRVKNQCNVACDWVFAGEGIATRKLDGMCAAVIDGVLYKRREIKPGKDTPEGFLESERDEKTGKIIGWVPVGEGPEDKYFREAWQRREFHDGTYELVGPKSQGGVEQYPGHHLISHNADELIFEDQPPYRDLESLKRWMTGCDIEGIVFHHEDGRMAKLKLKDFGLKRGI